MPLDAWGMARMAVVGAQELLWPMRCVCCDMPGELLCERCRGRMAQVVQEEACPVCGAPHGHITCTECEGDWESRSCVCALSYEGAAAKVVKGLKDNHELRLARVMAGLIALGLRDAGHCPARDGRPRFDGDAIDALCFVPATSAAYLRRGFDHMELVSRDLARLLGIPLADVLTRGPVRDQRGLGREGRKENVMSAVSVIDDVAGARLLLVDDVVTTGATMREASRALLARGAFEVTACALARVW